MGRDQPHYYTFQRQRTDCNLWQTTANHQQQQKQNRLRRIVATQRPRKCNITEFHCTEL